MFNNASTGHSETVTINLQANVVDAILGNGFE